MNGSFELVVVIGMGLLAFAFLAVLAFIASRFSSAGGKNRVPCEGCGQSVRLPAHFCPHCGRPLTS